LSRLEKPCSGSQAALRSQIPSLGKTARHRFGDRLHDGLEPLPLALNRSRAGCLALARGGLGPHPLGDVDVHTHHTQRCPVAGVEEVARALQVAHLPVRPPDAEGDVEPGLAPGPTHEISAISAQRVVS
jgi:hypothetical protein